MASWRQTLDAAAALRQAGNFEQARELVRQYQPANAQEQRAARLTAWAHEPFWWQAVVGRRCRLRRRSVEDVAFVRSLWAHEEFMSSFNRFARPLPAADADLAGLLTREHASIVTDARSVHWTIEMLDGKKVGMVSLVDVALANRRAETLIGIREFPYAGIAVEAMLLAIEFAFGAMGLNKLYTLIYAGNEASLRNTVHLGFEVEGRLRQHVVDPRTREPVDLVQTGLLRSDLAKPVLGRMSRRLLGRGLRV
jgi:ribosomal-protein-alanine N-acetyltransferase